MMGSTALNPSYLAAPLPAFGHPPTRGEGKIDAKRKGPAGPYVVPSTGSLPEGMPYSGRTSTRTRMRSPGL